MARWNLFDVTVWQTVMSSVAPSTKKSYERIFFDFVSFFDSRGLDFDSLSIEVILLFMKKYVGLSTSRIRTVVAALKFFLKVYRRLDLVENPLLDMFSKGAQNLAPIPREKNEIWNPATVLNWIESQPLPVSFLPCAREALILLLLATGWRVDDVWKLSCSVTFSEDAAVFSFVEKRQCKIKGKFTSSQAVGCFKTCERICPIKAVKRFQVCANDSRSDGTFLFISSTGKRASKDTLRKWAELILLQAGIRASAGSCRSASTSAACEKRRSIDDIMKSAGWSSENTFRKFYHRTVLPAHAPLNLLSKE
jgi:integrase